MIPVILCGGIGTGLWPLSRELHPKQFLDLTGHGSLLQETARRLDDLDLAGVAPPIIVCNDAHRFMVSGQLREAGLAHGPILLEPTGRNTAPAAVVAALEALAQEDDPLLLVLPSDHVIGDNEALRRALIAAERVASDHHLVTFGVSPSYPEPGYGYLRCGKATGDNVFQVEAFVEKPDLDTAREYVKEGGYYWNSGMFLFRARRYLEEVEKHDPNMLECCSQAHEAAVVDQDFIRLEPTAFNRCPADSIDYAVMEKTSAALLIPLDTTWSDVGSWRALWEIGQKDEDGNVKRGDVMTGSTSNTYIHSGRSLVSAVGVKDLVIVDTADALLVAHRDKAQDVREIVSRLKHSGRPEQQQHRKVYRPWGSYDSIDIGEGFQVKRITVYPGARLSLQSHQQRAEHWIIVRGTAAVTRDEETILLGENESTYISPGTRHRLENSGVEDLVLIEVQTGSYLGEDDIVRYEDDFNRNTTSS